MALTKCKECGKDVSTTAAACPYCGAPDFLQDDVEESIKSAQKMEQLKELIAREKPGSLPYTNDKEKLKYFVASRTTGQKMPRRSSQQRYSQHRQRVSNARNIGLIGVIMLFIGVFMPIISVPLMGNINYFSNGKGDGVIIIILAALSLILILAESYRVLWGTGIFALAILGYTYINIQSRLNDATASMKRELAGNPFAGLATSAIESIQIQWGWAVLVVGAILILVSAFVYQKKL